MVVRWTSDRVLRRSWVVVAAGALSLEAAATPASRKEKNDEEKTKKRSPPLVFVCFSLFSLRF